MILGSSLLGIGIFVHGIYVQFILNEPWGDKPMSDSGLVLFSLFMIAIFGGIILLLATAELTIEIHNRTVYYRFPPLQGQMKRIGLEELNSWQVRRYNPITEFGGYGWRGIGKKKARNVRGRMGLELHLKNGKILMLGTQKAEEIKNAMEIEWSKIHEFD